MTEKLKAGFWWARMKTGHTNNRRSHWVIVQLEGEFPFLSGKVVFDPVAPDRSTKQHDYTPLSEARKWEFGPMLAIPSPDLATDINDE